MFLDANRRLQDMLSASVSNNVDQSMFKHTKVEEVNILNYFLKSNSKKLLNKRYYFFFICFKLCFVFRAKVFYAKSDIPGKIKELVASEKLMVRHEVKVASNIGK